MSIWKAKVLCMASLTDKVGHGGPNRIHGLTTST